MTASPLHPSPRLETNQTLYCIYDIPDDGPDNITVNWYSYEVGVRNRIWIAASWIGNLINEAVGYPWDDLTGSTVHFTDLQHGHSITIHGILEGGLFRCEVEATSSRSQEHWFGVSPWIVVTVACKRLYIWKIPLVSYPGK